MKFNLLTALTGTTSLGVVEASNQIDLPTSADTNEIIKAVIQIIVLITTLLQFRKNRKAVN
jgi:hypothetical protein